MKKILCSFIVLIFVLSLFQNEGKADVKKFSLTQAMLKEEVIFIKQHHKEIFRASKEFIKDGEKNIEDEIKRFLLISTNDLEKLLDRSEKEMARDGKKIRDYLTRGMLRIVFERAKTLDVVFPFFYRELISDLKGKKEFLGPRDLLKSIDVYRFFVKINKIELLKDKKVIFESSMRIRYEKGALLGKMGIKKIVRFLSDLIVEKEFFKSDFSYQKYCYLLELKNILPILHEREKENKDYYLKKSELLKELKTYIIELEYAEENMRELFLEKLLKDKVPFLEESALKERLSRESELAKISFD